MDPVWYYNGNWLAGTPYLPASDAGFIYGAVVTDRLRTFRRAPSQLPEHCARFRRSCAFARVPIIASEHDLAMIVRELVERNNPCFEPSRDFAIVILATPGPVDGQGSPTLITHTLPLDYERYQNMFRRGAHLAVATTTRQISQAVVSPNVKHRSRLNWWMARQEVGHIDASADAVLLDDAGHITETASANIIIAKDGKLLSPPFATILPGISLQTTISLCQSLGRSIGEQPLTPNDCAAADEILLTNSNWCLGAVSRFNGQTIPWPGPIYQELLQAWKDKIGFDFVEQVMQAAN
jgi:branched-subunit amino acid aminotransferase/4-amino-4-deoxychorismate lyase